MEGTAPNILLGRYLEGGGECLEILVVKNDHELCINNVSLRYTYTGTNTNFSRTKQFLLLIVNVVEGSQDFPSYSAIFSCKHSFIWQSPQNPIFHCNPAKRRKVQQ